MIEIHSYTLIALFFLFLAGIITPAYTKYKSMTRKFKGNYMVFHEASRNRKRLILIFLISAILILYNYPLRLKDDFVYEPFKDLFIVSVNIGVDFLVMLFGANIGYWLLKYFEDKK